MNPINPGTAVVGLKNNSSALVERTRITPAADVGRLQRQTVTFPAKASLSASEFFTFQDGSQFIAVWLNRAADAEPNGDIYGTADFKIEVDLTAATTAAEVATAVKAAIDVFGLSGFVTVTDGLAGVLTFSDTSVGVAAVTILTHNEAEATAGAMVAAITVARVASNLLDKYFLIYDQAGTKFYVWFNVNGDGSDPMVADGTAIPVALALSATQAQVAAAAVAAIDAEATLVANLYGTAQIEVRSSVAGTTTDAAAGDSGFTISTEQGAAAGVAVGSAGGSPADISNNPSAV